MKLKELKLAVSKLGNETFIKVSPSGKYEKNYLQQDKNKKSYEIRFIPSCINKEEVYNLLKELPISKVHDFRIKSGLLCGSILVEL